MSSKVTIKLNESQRSAAIRLSVPPSAHQFEDQKCVGGTYEANPYLADSDGTLCTNGNGVYTPKICKTSDGATIDTGGVGTSSNLIACEGLLGGYGPLFAIDIEPGALRDFMGNPSPSQSSNRIYPNRAYTPAKCEGGFQDNAYADPYTADFDGRICLEAVPIPGTYSPATCRDVDGNDVGGLEFVSVPTKRTCEGTDHVFLVSQLPDIINPNLLRVELDFGTGFLTVFADETLDGTSGTNVDCINGSAIVVKGISTGDTFIPSYCNFDNNGTYDKDEALCISNNAVFTPAKCARCTNSMGEIAGDSSSKSICVNDPAAGTYQIRNETSEIVCRGAAHLFTPVRLDGLLIPDNHRVDSTDLVLKLPEALRLQIQEQQALITGASLVVSVEKGALSDLMRNPVNPNSTLPLATVPDTKPPNLSQARLDFGTGVLTVTTDEALLIDRLTGAGVAMQKLRLSNQTVDILQVPSSCSNGEIGIEQEECTGFTGFTFTASYCSNNAAFNNNKDSCINNGGQYFHPKCTRPSGKIVSDDGTGYSASSSACLGQDNNLGQTFVPRYVPTEVDTLSNSEAEVIQLGTGNVFTPAKSATCRSPSGIDVGVVPYAGTRYECTGLPDSNSTGVSATGNIYVEGTPNSCTNGGDSTSKLNCEGSLFLGKVGNTDSSVQFQIYIGESNRVRALRMSNTTGGDGTPLFFSVEPDAFTDLSNMRNNNTGALILVTEVADSVPPNLISASVNYSTGDMIIVSDELLDLSSFRFSTLPFNTSVLRITDISDDFSSFSQIAVLEGSVATKGIEITDGFQVHITMTEEQRARAVVKSRTFDSEAVYLSVFPGFIVDFAGNTNLKSNALDLLEADDIIPPVVFEARLDLGTGHFTLLASETIRKLHMRSFFNLSKMLLRNDGASIPFTLGDSEYLHSIESASLYFEQQTYIPGTDSDNFPGNVFIPSTCFVSGVEAPDFATDKLGCPGIFTDNKCLDKNGDVIDEGGTGTSANVYICELWSVGEHLDNSADSVEVKFILPEPMRIAALRMSNTSGGDGTPLRFQAMAGSFKDLSENYNLATASCGNISGYTGSELECTGLTGNIFVEAVSSKCTDSPGGNGNSVGDPTSELSCTGMTGNVYIPGVEASCTDGTIGGTLYNCTGLTGYTFTEYAPAKCQNSTGFQFSASSEEECTGLNQNIFTPSDPGVGNFTASKCAYANGTMIDDDGTGTAASLESCRGTATGLVYTPEVLKSCKDDSGNIVGSDDNRIACEGQDNMIYTYTPAIPASCSNNGDSSSQINCEGPGATGYYFSPTLPAYCYDYAGHDLGSGTGSGPAGSRSLCEGVPTGHNFVASNIVVLETEDQVQPVVTPSTGGGLEGVPGLNYNTGLFAVEFSEIIDGTPVGLIDLSRIVVTDRFNENNVSLAGSRFIYLRDRETLYVEVAVVPLQNIITIADDAEAVEQAISIPVKVHIYDGAIVDLAGNPNVAATELRLLDRNNSRGVPKIKSMSFDIIETGFMRAMKFFGSKRLPGDSAKFVPYNSTSCDVPSVGGIASPQSPSAVSPNGEVTLPYSGLNVTFAETSPPGYPFRLCYLFLADTEGLGFQIVPEVLLEVVKLESVAVSAGTYNQSVVGQKKALIFGGIGVRAGDSAKWVPSGGDPASACIQRSATKIHGYAVDNVTNILSITSVGFAYGNASSPNASSDLAFGDEISFSVAATFELCYAFTSRRASEPYKLHPEFSMTVSEITALLSTTGDSFATVVNQQKNFAFVGTGVATGDQVKYISGDATNHGALDDSLCVSQEADGGLSGTNVDNAVLSVVGPSGAFTNPVTFTLRSNPTKPFRLCYKFAQEPFHLYPSLTIESRSIIRVQTVVGAPDVAVIDMPKVYYFVGTGQQAVLDLVKIVSSTVESDAGCNGFGLAITSDGTAGSLISSVTTSASVGVDGKLEVSAGVRLTFLMESPFESWRLCYKFHNEPFKIYPQLTFSARKVVYITSSSGSNTLFVANHRVGKKWSIYGYGLREGDKLKWVPNTVTTDAGCGIESENAQPIEGNGVSANQLSLRTFTTLGLINTVPVELIIAAATEHGGPLVLCYKFATEPYKLYSNIEVSVAVLTNVTVNIGSDSQIVVGATKLFTFDGIGLLDGDSFKYVHPSISTDFGCGPGSENAHDGFVGTYSSGAATVVKFDTASVDGPLKLCYKFGSEVFKLYEGIRLSVASVDQIKTDVGDSGVAVVGVEKTMTFIGTAIAQDSSISDTFKYVLLEDRDSTNPGAVTIDSAAELLSIACEMRESQTINSEMGESVQADGTAKVTFTKMSPAGNPYVLCYKFGSEPYRALTHFTVVAKVLEGVLNGKPVITVSNAAANITFLGTHVSDFVFGLGGAGAGIADQAKWVLQPDNSTPAAVDANRTAGSAYCDISPPALGSNISIVDRRPCSSVYECGLVPRGTGQFVFRRKSEIFEPLRLCYRFGTESWQLIRKDVSYLNVYDGSIVEASTNTAVVGRAKQILFAGTTGVVTGTDSAKWVPFGSSDCAGMAGQSSGNDGAGVSLLSSPNTKLAPAPPGKYYGAPSVGTFLFLNRPKNGQPYILCYRFGGSSEASTTKTENPFFLFPQIRLHVKILEASVIPEGSVSEFFSGSTVTFRFEGRGIADGDLAMWIEKDEEFGSEQSDITCDEHYAKLTSKTPPSSPLLAEVVDAKATFVFVLDISSIDNKVAPMPSVDFVLCYKFAGEAFKLYDSLPIVDEREVTKLLREDSQVFQNMRARIKIALTTLRNDPATDLDYYPEGSASRAAFILAFRKDISRALNVQIDRIRVISLSRGSIIVEFVIDPLSMAETGGLLAQQASSLLEQMVSSRDPLIFGGEVTQYVDTGAAASPNPVINLESPGSLIASSENSSSASNAGDRGELDTFTEFLDGENVTTYVSTTLSGELPPFTTLRIVPEQASGLFAFKHRDFNVVESTRLATVTIVRLSGSHGRVLVSYRTSSGTIESGLSSATAGKDYTAVSGVIIFEDGVVEKSFTVPVVWDQEVESHYETIVLELSTVASSPLIGTSIEGQTLSARASRYSRAQIKIFDMYNPSVMSPSSTATEQSERVSSFDPRALIADSFGLDSGSTNATMGWGIVGNGGSGRPTMGTGSILQPPSSELASSIRDLNAGVVEMTSGGDISIINRNADPSLDNEVPLWVDTNGLYSVDQLYGSSEYDAACDYAAPVSPCSHSCAYGGDFGGDNGNGTGYGSGVLRLSGPQLPNSSQSATSFVTSGTGTMVDFPSSHWTFSLWIRCAAGSTGTILSYEVPATRNDGTTHGFGAHEVLVYNASSLVLVIRGTVNLEDGRRQMGLSTGVNVADGSWHHIAITWTASGGEVVVFKDGIIVFDGGPYQAETALEPGGTLVIGQAQQINKPCLYDGTASRLIDSGTDNTEGYRHVLVSGTSPGSLSPCAFEQGGVLGSLQADIQNIRLWDHVRSQHQVHLGMRWPFTALRLGLILYWHFDPFQRDLTIQDAGEDGEEHPGVMSPYGTSIIPGEGASPNPNYPCGDVYSNIWYWSAPKRFLAQLRYAYDGRLQYSMLVSSYSGTERSGRGSVELVSTKGRRYSYALEGFESLKSGRWMGFSVIFREDFGWISEPSGEPATFEELYAALQSAGALLIRGDHFVYSSEGSGGEASYINNVTITSGREV